MRGYYAGERRRAERTAEKDVFKEKLHLFRAAEDALLVLSLTRCDSFLNHAGRKGQSLSIEMYRLFAFEPLFNLHFGISKILKVTVIL